MDRSNKRESRQTGMTDKRIQALERARKNQESGLSRLDQAIKVIFILFKILFIIFSQENITEINIQVI